MRRDERRLSVRGVRRDPPDIRKLSRALLHLAMAEAEREAQAEQVARSAEAEITPPDEERQESDRNG
jgi:endonuclease/exonuclease/phosphatase family metal-dependent hydrolase